MLKISSNILKNSIRYNNLQKNLFHTTCFKNSNQKTPFKVFIDTFKSEIKKSEDLQSNIKALQDSTDKMVESDAYKKAKEAYETAKKGTTVTGEVLKKTGHVVGNVAINAWDSPVGRGTRHVVSATADVVDKATEPIRETKIYKDVKEVIDDGDSSNYGGFLTKEQRRLKREKLMKQKLEYELKSGIRSRPVQEDLEAGSNIVVHATAKSKEPGIKEKWDSFKTTTETGRKIGDLKMKFEESENGLISSIRFIGEKINWFFKETEAARVSRTFKEIDPTFNMEEFRKEVRDYIVPEILDAYIKGDRKVLQTWLSEAPFNIWSANAKDYITRGLVSAGRILDIRGVDIITAKILEPNTPVFVIGCRAQEIHLFKDAKTLEVKAGREDEVMMSTYAMVLTRVPEEMSSEETRGWRILELARGQSRKWN